MNATAPVRSPTPSSPQRSGRALHRPAVAGRPPPGPAARPRSASWPTSSSWPASGPSRPGSRVGHQFAHPDIDSALARRSLTEPTDGGVSRARPRDRPSRRPAPGPGPGRLGPDGGSAGPFSPSAPARPSSPRCSRRPTPARPPARTGPRSYSSAGLLAARPGRPGRRPLRRRPAPHRPDGGRRRSLFVGVAALVAVVTAVLNLDTAVVFLTPVLVVAARRRGSRRGAVPLPRGLHGQRRVPAPPRLQPHQPHRARRHRTSPAAPSPPSMLPAWVAAVRRRSGGPGRRLPAPPRDERDRRPAPAGRARGSASGWPASGRRRGHPRPQRRRVAVVVLGLGAAAVAIRLAQRRLRPGRALVDRRRARPGRALRPGRGLGHSAGRGPGRNGCSPTRRRGSRRPSARSPASCATTCRPASLLAARTVARP